MSKIILFTIFFILMPLASAEEAPRYNFGTTQVGGAILIQPGETLKVPAIYFFNVFGNRITHVTLYLTNSPKDLNVKLEPEMHEIQVNISGTIVTSNENLYVSPTQAVNEVPAVKPEGVEYIRLSGIEGYVPAKVAYLNITVPPDVPIGGKYSLSIRAVGSWFGQEATLALSQERSFTFTVQTVTHSFKEEIVEPKPEEKEKTDNLIYILILLIALAAMGVGFYVGRKK